MTSFILLFVLGVNCYCYHLTFLLFFAIVTFTKSYGNWFASMKWHIFFAMISTFFLKNDRKSVYFSSTGNLLQKTEIHLACCYQISFFLKHLLQGICSTPYLFVLRISMFILVIMSFLQKKKTTWIACKPAWTGSASETTSILGPKGLNV